MTRETLLRRAWLRAAGQALAAVGCPLPSNHATRWIVVKSLGLAVLLVLASSCGGKDSQTATAGPDVGGSGGSTASCEGKPCSCEQGFTSTTVCGPNGSSRCACELCPQQPLIAEPEVFSACGGDPVGAWANISGGLDLDGVEARFGDKACPRLVESGADTYSLNLLDGGEGFADLTAPNLTLRVMAECAVPNGASCETLDGCFDAPCGICLCQRREASLGRVSATWSRAGSQLTLEQVGGSPRVFDYCVNDQGMSLRDKNSGVVAIMKRFYVYGSPRRCEDRTQDGCAAGAAPGRDACLWDGSTCTGTPAPVCLTEDYNWLEGCIFTNLPPTCGGADAACAARSAQECNAVAGCFLVPKLP